MTMKCQNYGCDKQATVQVQGGVKPGERGGWSGAHCDDDAIEVVFHQLPQVKLGMPIHITKAVGQS